MMLKWFQRQRQSQILPRSPTCFRLPVLLARDGIWQPLSALLSFPEASFPVSKMSQSTLMETAAGHITRNMQNAWFEAVLRQDMAYFDVKDVAGQAIILSSNGAKYRSECLLLQLLFMCVPYTLISSALQYMRVALMMPSAVIIERRSQLVI